MQCNVRIESERALVELPAEALRPLAPAQPKLEAVAHGNSLVIRPAAYSLWDLLEQEVFGDIAKP